MEAAILEVAPEYSTSLEPGTYFITAEVRIEGDSPRNYSTEEAACGGPPMVPIDNEEQNLVLCPGACPEEMALSP